MKRKNCTSNSTLSGAGIPRRSQLQRFFSRRSCGTVFLVEFCKGRARHGNTLRGVSLCSRMCVLFGYSRFLFCLTRAWIKKHRCVSLFLYPKPHTGGRCDPSDTCSPTAQMNLQNTPQFSNTRVPKKSPSTFLRLTSASLTTLYLLWCTWESVRYFFYFPVDGKKQIVPV